MLATADAAPGGSRVPFVFSGTTAPDFALRPAGNCRPCGGLRPLARSATVQVRAVAASTGPSSDPRIAAQRVAYAVQQAALNNPVALVMRNAFLAIKGAVEAANQVRLAPPGLASMDLGLIRCPASSVQRLEADPVKREALRQHLKSSLKGVKALAMFAAVSTGGSGAWPIARPSWPAPPFS